jgi:hypothetical protein
MSADGSWSVCTHEHLMIAVLRSALATSIDVNKADGSWSKPNAITLTEMLFSLPALLQRQSCQQMVNGVFALMNLPSWFCSRAATALRQQMVHGVFALMNI